MSWICDATDRVFQRVPEEILQAAEAAAKAALEESDMYVNLDCSHLLPGLHMSDGSVSGEGHGIL